MRPTLVGLFLAVSASAWAQDGDDFLDEEDEPFFDDELLDEPPPERPAAPASPTPPPPAPPPDDEDLDFEDVIDLDDHLDDALDLDDEGPDVQAPGADTEALYRAKVREVEGLPPDEEVMAWEAYLERYPNSIFRNVIQARMDELIAAQFRQRIRPQEETVDADRLELNIVQPLHLPNVNPRTRLLVDLEIGFGAGTVFTGGRLDFEYAFLRQLSVHGGLSGTFTGWGAEAGARYAFVKSTRHELVATLMADLRVNFTNATFFQFRPALGLAKILGPAQLLATFGADVGTRDDETVALRGGLHVGVRLAPPVGIFAESDFYLRNLGNETLDGETSPFAFSTVSLGLRFYPRVKRRGVATTDALELAAGGHVPIASNYIEPYLGSVHLQGAYWMDDLGR